MFKSTKKNNRKGESEPQSQQDLFKHQGQYKLSTPMVSLLSSLLLRPILSQNDVPTQKLHELCEAELQRLAELKSTDPDQADILLDNELTLSVLDIQNGFLLVQRQKDIESTHISPQEQHTESYKLKPRCLSFIQQQIQKDEIEIKKFVDKLIIDRQPIDFSNCLHFFSSQINKLNKAGKEQLIVSRVTLLKTLTFFMKEALKMIDPEKAEADKGPSDGSIIYEVGASFLSQLSNEVSPQQSPENDVNKWSKYSSKCLQDKLAQLSNICEQITQLEIFNRTIQFSQLDQSQRLPFFKVVEVLISLHHRVSYLSRSKPKLLTELQNSSEELTFINAQVQAFLSQLQTDDQQQILPIDFFGLDDRWKSQLIQQFTILLSHLHRFSEIIISQDILHTENYQHNQNFISSVLLFTKIVNGEQEFMGGWMKMIEDLEHQEDPIYSQNQQKLIMVLDQCLSLQRCKSNRTVRARDNLSNRTNEELDFEVNKLIEDYERLQKENLHLASDLQIEHRLKQQLMAEVDQRQKLISSLSARNLNLENWLANKEQSEPSVDEIKEEEENLTNLEREVHQCREHNLFFREKLMASEKEKEQLREMFEAEQSQKDKTRESFSKVKTEKDRLQTECEELKSLIESLKIQNLRNVNRLNNMVADLTGEKVLMEQELNLKQKNAIRLSERLDMSEKKVAQYNKLIMNRLDDRDESLLPKLQRQILRLKKENEGSQVQIKDLQAEIQNMREEAAVMRFKVKQSQIYRQDEPNDDENVSELRTKLKNYKIKNQLLAESYQSSKEKVKDFKEQLKQSKKVLNQLQEREQHLSSENQRLTKAVKDGEKIYQEMQQKVEEMRLWTERQIRNAKETVSKKDIELFDKISVINTQNMKIRMLEEQLNQRTQLSERTSVELVETKVKQYEITIQTSKILRVKLEEQACSLRRDLQMKIESELRLQSEIQRLSKEIDTLKRVLDKNTKQLTKKQSMIKLQRDKNDENHKKLRQFELKQKVRKERIMTPERDTTNNQSKTLKSPVSDIEFKVNYDNKRYTKFEKQHQLLKKQHKTTIETLKYRLEESEKTNQFLKGKLLDREQSKRKCSESLSQASNQIEIQRYKDEINQLKQSRADQQSKYLKVKNEKKFLQEELQNTKQRLAEQSQNFKIIAKEKKLFQEKIEQLQREKQSESSSEKGQLKSMKQHQEHQRDLQAKIRMLQELNKDLKEDKDHQMQLMGQQFDNMFNHYQAEMKRVIKQTDSKNDEQLTQIKKLTQTVRFLQNNRLQVNLQHHEGLAANIKALENSLAIVTKELEETKALHLLKKTSFGLTSKTSGEYSADLISLNNLLQYAFRIIIFSMESSPQSPEASTIKAELRSLGQELKGIELFSRLQEFTIDAIGTGATEEYKRDLKTKAQELQLLKGQLEKIIQDHLQDNNRLIKYGVQRQRKTSCQL